MRYFDDLFSVEHVKAHYKRLAFAHHPDLGGDTAIMQAVNDQYHEALKRLHGSTSKGESGKDHRYSYDEGLEQSVIDKIAFIVGARLPGVNVALIGTWLWVTGDTKPYKEILKANGFKWHAGRVCWYFTASKHWGRPSRFGLATIAQRYGYKEFKDSDKRKAIN